MNNQAITLGANDLGLPMLIHLSRVRAQAARRITWHAHEGFELLFLLGGATAYEFAGGNTLELHGGHFLVIPPRVVHRGHQNMRSPSTLCGLAFRAEDPAEWRGTAFSAPDVASLRDDLTAAGLREHAFSPALRWLIPRLTEIVARNPTPAADPAAALVLRSWVSVVLAEARTTLGRPRSAPKAFVAAAIEYLGRNLDQPVSMADLVRHVGFGRARLFDLFKAETGLTPHDYLQRLRVEKAGRLLRETNLPVTEIALTAGFNSVQYFSTVFARYSGLAPSVFRKAADPPAAPAAPINTSKPSPRPAAKPNPTR
jgi:AraC-like DNA-binding protein/uncharacterized RmlC-like cupin family protein